MFKLVSCKPGASRELAPRPDKPKCYKLVFGYVVIGIIFGVL